MHDVQLFPHFNLIQVAGVSEECHLHSPHLASPYTPSPHIRTTSTPKERPDSNEISAPLVVSLQLYWEILG